MSDLFRIENGALVRAARSKLANELMIQEWVRDNLALVGVQGVLIGREVSIANRGRIDLLAMDKEGSLIIIELKRDRTPREIVAQVLDYASWVATLSTRDVHALCLEKTGRTLDEVYRERFSAPPPDTLNASHQMMIVASSMDETTTRIIEYLSEEHGVGINVSFFNVFEDQGVQWLSTDTLLEQEEVAERATRKTRAPWSGYWYLTAGAESDVPWEDLRRHGYVVASGGKWYSDGLARLSVGDRVFFYQKNTGYLGHGVVRSEMQPADDFMLGDGRRLVDAVSRAYFTEFGDDPEKRAYVIGVDWKKTVDRAHAKTFAGIFANQNIACKIYDEKTVEFLVREFGLDREEGNF
ncbi:endonuclease NucS domain-containing protein [Stappia stellulata]|uniref:endonuclease NucS domain-containing protein n=1 Tax=Stappia stellulata TaxID=71235 RepID=UPI0003F7441A|nr:endonuclease NucS domain-containing protein [Stappia stellulata]